jgi:hypothetical protein
VCCCCCLDAHASQVDYLINTAKIVPTVQDTERLKAAFAAIPQSARPGLQQASTRLVNFDNLVCLVLELIELLR